MTQAHKLVIALITAALLPLQARASALPPVSHASVVAVDAEQGDQGDQSDENDVETQGKSRGVLQGEVLGVDYARGILHLQTARQGRLSIQILPSTSIMRRGDQYGTIADLAPGTRLSVYVSEVSGHLTAQIIRIR
ncbi:MAG: hypothetical protein M3126_04795 [Candidatus Eremiobacteraeota bacterium]|nr:hypothetical protein [Candidatus Eremiobacteraeota bacterium]